MKRSSFRSTGGSTLMLVLWALIVLSAVVFGWVKVIDRGIDSVNDANRGMEARALAHSGIAVALHPGVSLKSPHLNGIFERDSSYHVTIESEGSRLNLNYLLSGADPAKILFLKQNLAQRGFTFQQREMFVDCLLDWVSPGGGTRRLNGVPENPDYRLPHRPLQSLDEVALIKGSGPLVSDPHWKDSFTLFSTGPLDLESVKAEQLSLIPGIGEQRAQRFVKLREERRTQGEDKDGHPFKDLTEALSYLGFTQSQFAQLSAFLGFRDPVLHVKSVGQAGKEIRQVDAIVRKVTGANANILLWTEK